MLYLSGEKLDDDKQDAAVPEVFIDQDQVLLKVCKYSKQHTVNIFIIFCAQTISIFDNRIIKTNVNSVTETYFHYLSVSHW